MAGVEEEFQAVNLPISQAKFEQTFDDRDATFSLFTRKVVKELERILHPTAVVDKLSISGCRKDASSNIHAGLRGTANAIGEAAEISGEIVWLKNLKTFRGRMWTSLANPSDVQLLIKARDSFRESDFVSALRYLEAIQSVESLPRSTVVLKETVCRRIGEGKI